MPEPLKVELHRISEPAYDAQWGVIRGTVGAVSTEAERLVLSISSGEGSARVVVPWAFNQRPIPAHLIGMEVEATGVIAWETEKVFLAVSSLDYIHPTPEALAARFDRPVASHRRSILHSLERNLFASRVAWEKSLARPDFFMQMGARGEESWPIWIESSGSQKLRTGDFIDVWGTSEFLGHWAIFRDALVRPLWTDEPYEPPPAKPLHSLGWTLRFRPGGGGRRSGGGRRFKRLGDALDCSGLCLCPDLRIHRRRNSPRSPRSEPGCGSPGFSCFTGFLRSACTLPREAIIY
jgi:hypothetical protein